MFGDAGCFIERSYELVLGGQHVDLCMSLCTCIPLLVIYGSVYQQLNVVYLITVS